MHRQGEILPIFSRLLLTHGVGEAKIRHGLAYRGVLNKAVYPEKRGKAELAQRVEIIVYVCRGGTPGQCDGVPVHCQHKAVVAQRGKDHIRRKVRYEVPQSITFEIGKVPQYLPRELKERKVVLPEKIVKTFVFALYGLAGAAGVGRDARAHWRAVQYVVQRHFVRELKIPSADIIIRQTGLAVYVRQLIPSSGKEIDQHIALVGIAAQTFTGYQ